MSTPTLEPDPGIHQTVYVCRGSAPRGQSRSGVPARRAFTLVLLTFLVPGSAQLAVGNRTLGRFGLRVWLGLWCLGIAVALLFLASHSFVIGLLSRSEVLGGVQVVIVGLAALWAVLFVDTWRLARPGTLVLGARRWLTGLVVGLLVLTSGGMAYAASVVGAGRDALDVMFGSSRAAAATNGRYNILLLGGDSGADRVGTRPDSIQLVSVDARTGRTVTFGFSRDTENITFRPGSTMARLMPGGWNCGDRCMLNGLYTWGQDHQAEFPAGTKDPGLVATREAVEALSGLTVQYYVLVDLRGFQDLVTALGGVEVNVQQRTPIGGGTSRISGWIEPGRQHLDGYHALWYARSRQGSTNYERMARQRCVMTALLQQVNPRSVVLRFPEIASATKGLLRTDLPRSELGTFADLAIKARAQKISSVNFVPPLIKPWDYDPAAVKSTVASTIAAAERAPAGSQQTGAPASHAAGQSGGTEKAGSAAPASSAGHGGTPSAPANAKTADLSEICSAG